MILTITLDLSNSAFDDDPLNEAESVMFDAMDRAKLSFDGGEELRSRTGARRRRRRVPSPSVRPTPPTRKAPTMSDRVIVGAPVPPAICAGTTGPGRRRRQTVRGPWAYVCAAAGPPRASGGWAPAHGRRALSRTPRPPRVGGARDTTGPRPPRRAVAPRRARRARRPARRRAGVWAVAEMTRGYEVAEAARLPPSWSAASRTTPSATMFARLAPAAAPGRKGRPVTDRAAAEGGGEPPAGVAA